MFFISVDLQPTQAQCESPGKFESLGFPSRNTFISHNYNIAIARGWRMEHKCRFI